MNISIGKENANCDLTGINSNVASLKITSAFLMKSLQGLNQANQLEELEIAHCFNLTDLDVLSTH